MKTRFLLVLGWVIPVLFWITTVACGLMMGEYNHLSRMVSELGAIGTPTRLLFSTGLLSCAALSVLFVIGLVRACRESDLGPAPVLILLISFSIPIAGAAIFPFPLRLHLILGLPAALLPLSPLAALIWWRRMGGPSAGIVPWALASLLVMLLGFLAFLPGVLPGLIGLKQRFAHIGWSIWFCSLGSLFLRRFEDEPKERWTKA
jgi:hypothetical protein